MRKQYVPYEKSVTIHEHRATTDESLRLLSEMQNKVKDGILKTIHVDNNSVKATASFLQGVTPSLLGPDDITMYLKFMINGKLFEVTERIEHRDWNEAKYKGYRHFENSAVFRLIHKKLSEAIAMELLKQSPDIITPARNSY